MAANCDLNLDEITERMETFATEYLSGEWPLKELKNKFKTELKTLIEYGALQNTTVVTDLIYNTMKEYGIVDLSPEFFLVLNIQDLLTGILLNVINTNQLDSSAELISPKENEQIQLRRNVTALFLNDAYGMVTDARTEAQNIADLHIHDALFVNRGSIDNPVGVVKDSSTRNDNMRKYQQLLLNKIVEYLNSIVTEKFNLTPELKEALANPILYNNGKITNALSVLKHLIDKYLSPNKYKSETTDIALDSLRSLYNEAHDNSSPNKEMAKLELDAYNASIILNNFDKYLHVLLGNIIEITDFGNNTISDNKYSISGKTAKILTTWTNKDNRDVEAEADFVTKLSIRTTPLYNRKTNTAYSNKFLTFADYLYLIGKLKDLSWNEAVMNTIFGEIDNNGNIKYGTIDRTLWNTLHDKTKRVIKGKSLSSVINSVRRNPRKYLGVIFDILNNSTFLEKYSHVFKLFSESDLNKLYSLHKGIFSLLDSNSIYNLSSLDAEIDYFSFITLTADTIYNTQFVQYYRDNDGIIKARTFISLNINNLRRGIEITINISNSSNTIKDSSYFDLYNIKDNTFTIPGTNLQVTVNPRSNKILFTENGKPAKLENYWEVNSVQQFIDSKLRIGLNQNIELLNTLLESVQNLKSVITNSLLSFASRVLINLYLIFNQINTKETLELKEEELKNTFGDDAPKYNKLLDIVESINPSLIPTLRSIAIAVANATGVTTATLVKDGEGNGQSLLTQSRLLGSHLTLFELQEKLKDSATKDCLILTVPGLYEGTFTANEYYNEFEGSKKFTDMSVSELAYSSFILDYIGSLVKRDGNDNSVIEEGHAMFLPSVFSDKGVIGRIKINLNKSTSAPDGSIKLIREFNHQELRWLIAKLFGTIYTNMYEAVLTDWNILFNDIYKVFPDIPTLNYLSDFQEFNTWWYNKSTDINFGNDFIRKYGKNPSEFIKYFTLLHNKQDRLHPLTIIDQTHLRVKDQTINIGGRYTTVEDALNANQVLISQIARYNPIRAQELGIDLTKYKTEQEFWNLKHKELLKSALKSKFLVNTSGKNQKELKYLRDNYPSWINNSGNVILAKVNWSGRIIDVTSTRDLIHFLKEGQSWKDIIDNIINSDLITIHPALETWNYLDYLFTLEFMDCTVGSFINHPVKSKSNDPLILEAALYLAQHKRNVSFTASMHEFLLNLLNGIPEEYNIAVIEDIKDEQGTILGILNGIKPFDGATFVNPFVVILENNSLGGARAGITKKLFVHFKDARTGGGGIIKTCGFGLNNDWLRNSPFLDLMMRKMTNHVWLNEDGSPALVNITKDFRENTITLKNTYYKENGRAFEIVRIKSLGDNMYLRVIRELDINEEGKPIKNLYISPEITEVPKLINTNYALWNYLGGKNSMSVDETGNTLKLSNSSVENVVKIMNNTAGLNADGTIITRNGVSVNEIETLDDLWQPLKQVDVHYVPTAGAVKQGAANINSRIKYTSTEKDHPNDFDYDIQRIKMYQSGILLDKEHHADDAELSLMTLVISACAAKGYTFEAASKLYDALRKSTEIGIREHLNGVKEWLTSGNPSGVLEAMYEAIIHSLGTGNSNQTNFAYLVASDLIKQAKEGKKIKFSDAALPLSDKTVYSKIFSTVASYLTNAGIKQKIPGILSVLTPSHNIFKLYAGRKYESFTNPEQELAELLNEEAPVFDSAYQWTQGLLDFSGLQLVYVNPGELISLTDGQPVAMRNPHDGRVLIDLELMKAKFDQKAWRNTRNSEPLDYDFKSFDEWMRFALLHEAMHNVYLIKDGESRFDYETRVNKQALKRLQNNISNLELGREYFVTRDIMTEVEDADGNLILVPVPLTLSELIRTPSEYHKLKLDILDGKVTRVVENVTVGRDLAAYNVRFETVDGQRFQLWDLDSAQALFELNEIKESKTLTAEEKNARRLEIKNTLFPGYNFPLKDLEKHIRRMVLKDLMNLSNSVPDILLQYDTFLLSVNEFQPALDNAETWYDKYVRWVNIYFGTGNGNKLEIPGFEGRVTAENFNNIVEPLVHKLIEDSTQVRIGSDYSKGIPGKLHKVNKQTINILAYELIMPKTFATAFGLSEFDDLNIIQNNQDWFVGLYRKNQEIKVNKNNYTVALKTSTGNHTYLLSKSLLNDITSELTKVDDTNIGKIVIDGKTLRVDNKGNIIYEITNDFELYVDDQGNEVIVTDDLPFYVNNTSFESILLSESLKNRPVVFRDIIKQLRNSKNKLVKRFLYYTTNGTRDLNEIYTRNLEFNTIPDINDPDYESYSIIKALREKHTSFLKALDVVAARIPSQSMQSFMPMRVVAFDNPDINTAYVSTMLILLQGSDYDVDAVSIATFDIDRNGKLRLWSPYANIETLENMEASMELPIPTGKTIEFKESNKLIPSRDFLIKYRPILGINPIYNEDGTYSLTDLDVNLNIRTVEDLKLLKEFLAEVESLEIPAKRYWENFARELNNNGFLFGKFTLNHIPSLFARLKEIVDEHNLYYDSLNSYTLSKITNNSTIYNMYKVSSDPVNLLEAHVSVDATTGPLKKRASKSAESADALTSTPGNGFNKFEGINVNQVGKKGIGICATGLKSYFGLTQYCNWVLNNGTTEELERILLGPDHKGIKIGGYTYKTLANIRAIDINTIKNSELFAAISEIAQDEDIALTLSALLSLATDNAKELTLSKLNAGIKMLGMYVYGLSIGMDFNDIANIIMSPVGDVIKTMLDDDVFALKSAFNTVNESLFKYFTDGPFRQLLEYDISADLENNKLSKSPVKALQESLANIYNLKNEKTKKPLPLSEILINIAQDSKPLIEKIRIIESLRGAYSGRIENDIRISKYATEIYNQLLDFVEDYIQLSEVIHKNPDIFEDFLKLAAGAQEMKTLGLVLSLNLGIKTTSSDFLTLMNNLRRAIYNKTGNLEDMVDLTKFVLDDNPYIKGDVEYKSYREYIITRYEGIKEAFNIFDVVDKVPHFMGYLLALVTTNVELNNSFTFRSIDNLLLPIKEKLGEYIKEDNLIRGIQNYCGDWLLKKWMLDTNLLITIPIGNLAFDKQGNLYKLTEDTTVLLGTDWGNVTFRMWMENEVIPNLKLGIIQPGKAWAKISNNKFIKDLGNDLLTKTISGNPTVVYTLPINMLPSTDAERSVFNQYKSLFNDLQYGYLYNLTTKIINPDESISLETTLSKPINITDLFIYYAMIANSWKLGQNSLVPITEDFLNKGIIEKLHDYITDIDKSGFTLDLKNIIWEDILPYIAPSESPYSSKTSTIWAKNPKTLKRVLMLYLGKKEARELRAEGDSSIIGNYRASRSIDNLNYFISNLVESGNSIFNAKISEGNNISILYDSKSRKILSLAVEGINDELNAKLLSNLKYFPMKKVNGAILPNMDLLLMVVNHILNEC